MSLLHGSFQTGSPDDVDACYATGPGPGPHPPATEVP